MRLFVISVALALIGSCSSSVSVGVDGTADDAEEAKDATASDNKTDKADDQKADDECPSDAKEGTACSGPDRTCGSCASADPCAFCNMLRCEDGKWVHVEVHPDPSCSKEGTACTKDADCVYKEGGCCGACMPHDATPPELLPCGAQCQMPVQCLCEKRRCVEGTLPYDASCDPEHDACSAGLKCCATCCGADAGPNPDHDYRCVEVDESGLCPGVP